MKKFITVGIILVSAFVASLFIWQHFTDAKYRRDIVGTWSFNQDGALTIASDGSWSIKEWKRTGTNSFAGTWQISDGVFCMTTTSSRIPVGPSAVGGIQRYKIMHLDRRFLVYGDGGFTHKRIQ